MKKLLLIPVLLLCHIVMSAHILEYVPVSEIWYNKYPCGRSYVPAPPMVDLTGNVLSVKFEENQENLEITITREDGSIYYQGRAMVLEIIDEDTPFPNPEIIYPKEKKYHLRIEHPAYGYVEGEFQIN